eukprot:scaffold5202_cov110-Isochrysis_galbana.AAC.3
MRPRTCEVAVTGPGRVPQQDACAERPDRSLAQGDASDRSCWVACRAPNDVWVLQLGQELHLAQDGLAFRRREPLNPHALEREATTVRALNEKN